MRARKNISVSFAVESGKYVCIDKASREARFDNLNCDRILKNLINDGVANLLTSQRDSLKNKNKLTARGD